MGTNASRGHFHNGSGSADWAVGETEELEGSVVVAVVVQDPAGPELLASVVAPEGWVAAWANRFEPSAPDAGEDLAVAWDPERVVQVAMTLEPVTAAEEAALAETAGSGCEWTAMRCGRGRLRRPSSSWSPVGGIRRRGRWGSGCERPGRGRRCGAGRSL